MKKKAHASFFWSWFTFLLQAGVAMTLWQRQRYGSMTDEISSLYIPNYYHFHENNILKLSFENSLSPLGPTHARADSALWNSMTIFKHENNEYLWFCILHDTYFFQSLCKLRLVKFLNLIYTFYQCLLSVTQQLSCRSLIDCLIF